MKGRKRWAIKPIAALLRRFVAWRTARPTPPPGSIIPVGGNVDAYFRLLAENCTDVILRIKPDLRIDYVTPSLATVYGWAPAEVIDRSALEFILPEDRPIVEAAATRLYTGEADQITVTIRSPRRDGTVIWAEASARLIRDSDAQVPDHVLIIRDITTRKQLEQDLAAMAMTDGLTGLANRRAFDEALNARWRETIHKGSQMSVLLIDVDYFKLFNDCYGHQVGDDCLRAVATAVATAVRHDDIVARYGGEEIAIILSDSSLATMAEVAERVRIAVEALDLPHANRPDSDRSITVSIGGASAVARAGGTVKMPEGLLTAADNALYKAKHMGRNRVETALLLAPIANTA